MLTNHRLKIKRQPRSLLNVTIGHNPHLLAKYDRASQKALLKALGGIKSV
jgi:hypothetical protein